MFSISLPPPCALFRAVCQSLIGRVARYAPSSDFCMQPQIAHNLMAINFEHLLIELKLLFPNLEYRQYSHTGMSVWGSRSSERGPSMLVCV